MTPDDVMVQGLNELTPDDLLDLYQRSRGALGLPVPTSREIRRSINDAEMAWCVRERGQGRLAACLVAENRDEGEVNLVTLMDPTLPSEVMRQQVSAWLTVMPAQIRRVFAAVPQSDTAVRGVLESAGFSAQATFITMQRPQGPLPSNSPEAASERNGVIIAFDPDRQDEVRRLCNDAFHGHWGTTAWSEQDWQDDVVRCETFLPNCSFLHLDDDERVDAFVLSSRDPSATQRVVDVDLLGTRADARGRGIATKLLRQTVAAANRLACALELIVHQDGDQGALKIYRSVGFRTVTAEATLVLERA